MDKAMALARRLSELPAAAYAKNKHDSRQPAIEAIRASL
jgi:hypothetical protein